MDSLVQTVNLMLVLQGSTKVLVKMEV